MGEVNGQTDRVAGRDTSPRGQSMALVFLATAILLAVSVTLTWWMGRVVLESIQSVARQRAILQQLDEFVSTVTHAETSRWDFLLSGQERYLEPYRAAVAEVRSRLDGLRRLVASGDLDGPRVARVARLADERLAQLDKTIRLRREKGLDAARAVVLSGVGKRIMDALRAEVGGVRKQEDAEYQRTVRRADRTTNMRTVMFVATALLNLAFLAWAYRRIMRDIREVKQAGESLRESEEKFRSLAESSNVPIGIAQGGRFIYANPCLITLTGYTPEEFYRLSLLQMVHPDFRVMMADGYRRGIQGDPTAPTQFEYKIITKSGEERWVVLSPVRIELRGIPSIIGSAIDVTEYKQTVAALRESEDALQRTNEDLEARVRERTAELREAVEELKRSNDDLEKFAYISSHDLQEPLRMIGSYVGLLALNYKDKLDEDARTFIGYAEEGAVRMSNLIKDLLAYSRVSTQAQQFAPTDARAVVKQVLDTLQIVIQEANAHVTVGELPTVPADASQLGQVFQNLIANALKYRKEDVPPEIHIAAERKDDRWLFTVKDNGLGIDPRFHDQIFVAFKRLHADRAKYPGSGIGLAIVKRIVERHHGRVCVDSKSGEGSTFYFTLPAENSAGP